MKVIRMKQVPGQRNKRGVEAKRLLHHDHVTVMNLNLQAGDEVPSHQVPVDVFFYVVSGEGTIHIGDEQEKVSSTDIVVCPKDTPMAVSADRGSDLSILNVKTPSL